MMTHTKGPWTIEVDTTKNRRHVALKGDKYIAEVRFSTYNPKDPNAMVPEDQANARLIASAPDLLEALELATATIERLADTQAKTASVQGTLSVANEAIQKGRA